MYLYRAVDSSGQTLDVMLSEKRDAAATQFLKKALNVEHTVAPRVINVDKNAAYPRAVDDLKAEGTLSEETELRPVKYLNNQIEQDHCWIKRLVRPGLGFKSFSTANCTLQGYEAMAMIRKGQVQSADRGDVTGQISFIHQIFGIAA